VRIDIETIRPFSLIFLIIVIIYLKIRKRKHNSYLMFFSLFYFYIVHVIGYTIFPLWFDKELIEIFRKEGNLMSGINFIPLKGIYIKGVNEIQLIGNIIITIPFGFGLPFIVKNNFKSIMRRGLFFALSIEILQFLISIFYGFSYRSVDINDILLNLIGIAIGFSIFRLLSKIYQKFCESSEEKGPFWSYLHFVFTGHASEEQQTNRKSPHNGV